MNDHKPITAEEIKARLAEAAATMRLLPPVSPRPYQAAWPTVIHDEMAAYGYSEFAVRPGPPTPSAIARMDECLEWLRWLPREYSRLLWWRADGTPWDEIAMRLGVKKRRAITVYNQQVEKLLKRFSKRF